MQFLEQFLEMMLAERGIAKNSYISYKKDLLDFYNFIEQCKLSELAVIIYLLDLLIVKFLL